MSETQSVREVEPNKPLADAVREIFERRAAHGERTLVIETYRQKFQKLLESLPEEDRDKLWPKMQKLFVNIGAWFSEYGARICDFVRLAVLWPLARNNKAFPRDVFYQRELARSQAWGDFAIATNKTATSAHMAYRNSFLPTAATGSVIGAVGAGAYYGLSQGWMLGLQGAALGAAAGAAIGGGYALFLRLKDKIIGRPVFYYNMNISRGVFMDAANLGASAA